MKTTMAEKLYAKATELEAQAAALRLAAQVFDGMAHTEKHTALARTLAHASTLRHAQRNGHGPVGEAHAAAPTRKAPSKQLQQARTEKRDQILAILRAHGKPMPIAKLKAAAAAKGITSLTGMIAYVRGGLLKQAGTRGNTRYSVAKEQRTDDAKA